MHDLFSSRRYLIPFRASLLPQIFTETLVIGAGVAGLRAAVEASQRGGVILLCKGSRREAATEWAQGGIAAAIDPADSPEAHALDTLSAGAGLCDEAVVRGVAAEAPERIEELLRWGMRIDRDALGAPALGREGGHGANRIIHAGGDATGRELMRTLWERVNAQDNVRVFDECAAIDLLTPEDGAPRCLGALTHHPRYGLQIVRARSTLLATGGAGAVWRETTTPSVCAGEGVAMAHRAGARVADMAFMQFHPTTLYIAGASRALISEAVRGEGAFLVDHAGDRFMANVHPMVDLAPRDVVARAIVSRLARTGRTHVFLDARGVGGFTARFPGISRRLADFAIDPATDLIPVHPAAHYTIGGVATDARGAANLDALFCAGEAACTGLHGANRLASNSLLEGLVMGARAGRAAAEHADAQPPPPCEIVSEAAPTARTDIDLADIRSSLRSAMWRSVGVVRNPDNLADTAAAIDFWASYVLDTTLDSRRGWEVQNMLTAAALVVRSALWRKESRGCHTRADFDGPQPSFAVHDRWTKDGDAPATIPADTPTTPPKTTRA